MVLATTGHIGDGSVDGYVADTETPIASLTGAARVGADLRSARERLGWPLADVAHALRIRTGHLEALEAGRIAALPGMAYALGFARSYGTALGLDGAEMARRLKADVADLGRKPDLSFPAPVPERGVPAGAVVLLSVVLAVGAYTAWYRLSGEGRLPAEVAPAVPERLAPLAQQAVPPAAPRPAPAPEAGARTELSQALEPIPPRSISPSQAAAAMPIPAPIAQAAPPANPDDPRIVVRAKADAWISVRDKAGQSVVSKLLHAGDTWPVPPKGALLLTTGNAGGTELLVDGVLAPSIGASGAVRRDLPLDPDMIRDGKLPPAPSTAAPVVPASVVAPASLGGGGPGASAVR